MFYGRAKGPFCFQVAAVLAVLAVYLYPRLRARVELGATPLPPIFAADLSLYLNLSNLQPAGGNDIINPYYRIPVPSQGSGYLNFSLAPTAFGHLNNLFGNRTWFSLLVWNAFWWALFGVVAVWVFGRFLPENSAPVVILGLGLVMLFNFGILKTLLLAWLHLPSLAPFTKIGLPYMRAFIPVIPCAFVLAYLGLQMEALRRKNTLPWIAMGALQLLPLAIFPYATLMMAGITAISVPPHVRTSARQTWQTPVLYGMGCALLDFAFLRRGSLGYYDNRSSPVHLQPQVLPHLIGGNWLLIVALTAAIALNKKLLSEVKWPLVGLGASNALLMLGDAIVPASTLLLSHHAAHFVHLTTATLVTFLASALIASMPARHSAASIVVFAALLLVFLNGMLLAIGNYRGALGSNRELAQLSRLANTWDLRAGDLVIARSKAVDDDCGWVALLSKSPLLFCTDAEVMLTPQQNHDIHRFRQAVYLYLIGKDPSAIQRALSAPDPSLSMYQLGYWAEAVSPSSQERQAGIRAIQSDLIPLLERVEDHDPAVSAFFHEFQRIFVIDNRREPAFLPERLTSFLTPRKMNRTTAIWN